MGRKVNQEKEKVMVRAEISHEQNNIINDYRTKLIAESGKITKVEVVAKVIEIGCKILK